MQKRARRFSTGRLLASAIAVVAAFAAVGVGACSGSSSTELPPTTGILIRAETLTAGHGCGKDPTQLYKYAVVVFGYGDPNTPDSGEAADAGDPAQRASYRSPVTSNVFDCFTDGAFISLPARNGSSTFRLEVYAFNEPSFAASRDAVNGAGSVGTNADALFTAAAKLREANPTWTTECTATQQENVQALANCDLLAPGLSGLGGGAGKTRITLETARFELPDGRVATCGPSPSTDGGLDAGDGGDLADASDDASDASSEAGTPEPSGPIKFTTVRVRPRMNAAIAGPDVDLACPTPYLAEVAPEPVRYELDVALLDESGNLVDTGAQTVCRVTSVPGETSSAVCH